MFDILAMFYAISNNKCAKFGSEKKFPRRLSRNKNIQAISQFSLICDYLSKVTLGLCTVLCYWAEYLPLLSFSHHTEVDIVLDTF